MTKMPIERIGAPTKDCLAKIRSRRVAIMLDVAATALRGLKITRPAGGSRSTRFRRHSEKPVTFLRDQKQLYGCCSAFHIGMGVRSIDERIDTANAGLQFAVDGPVEQLTSILEQKVPDMDESINTVLQILMLLGGLMISNASDRPISSS